MYTMSRGSVWSWFDEDMRKKAIITFSFSMTLTFNIKFFLPVTRVRRPLYFHLIRSFYGFFVSSKSEARDRRTDGRGATLIAVC